MEVIKKNHALAALLRVLMLVIFVLGQTPLANAGIYFAASFSSEHEVQLENHSGKLAVVLHHRGQAQCHTPLTKALLYLANITENGQQDHVLALTSAANNLAVTIDEKWECSQKPAPTSVFQLIDTHCSLFAFATCNLATARPPPPWSVHASVSTLCCLRTIVLLV